MATFYFSSEKNVEVFISSLLFEYCKFPVTYERIQGVKDVELVLHDSRNSTAATTRIVSLYAISLYLKTQQCEEQKQSRYSSEMSVDKEFFQDDLIVWTLCTLLPAFQGVNKRVISGSLKQLTRKLNTRHHSGVSLVDILIYGACRLSFTYWNLKLFANCSEEFERFFDHVETHPAVQTVLQRYLKHLRPFLEASSMYQEPCVPFYITTAINYTNGSPHLGHAYESLIADVVARFHEINGEEVFFSTGTDEHGQKIALNAERQKKQPLDICNVYAKEFIELNRLLDVRYTTFVRTTSTKHKAICQDIWSRAFQKGDIYLGTYTGWYNIREERFVPEMEAATMNYQDPMNGEPLQRMQEESYFFRLSKYQTLLIQHIMEHENFIQPAHRRSEILQRLKEPLLDLSCSRKNFSWGIPVPNAPHHVMYVWFDALSNYLTALDFGQKSGYMKFWPPSLHLVGKDITWFHCVIWPCILMSLELELPKTVFAHGFVLAKDGSKMSKSLNNMIDPFDVMKTLKNSDPFRFYLIHCGEVDRDLKFDLDQMYTVHNSELADTVGNLVHRASGLCLKYCQGQVPHTELPKGCPPFRFELVRWRLFSLFKELMIHEALNVTMGVCRDTNKYLTEKAPWSITDPDQRTPICRILLEAVYYIGHLLYPFMPHTAEKIFHVLNTPRQTLRSLSCYFDNLKPKCTVTSGDVLFEKIVSKDPNSNVMRCRA